ncbi:MAG: hypothetical protein VZR02_00770 [Lachnospiraceae bacterium]|nr:hypothetical protein [Lachnospiraceae bacterium]
MRGKMYMTDALDPAFSYKEIEEYIDSHIVYDEEADECLHDNHLEDGLLLKEGEPLSPPIVFRESSSSYGARPKAGSHPHFRSLNHVLDEIEESFQERLIRLANERDLSNAEIYKRANLSKQHFSKILRNKDYRPQKGTAIALALALHLNLDETRDFLARAGYALSPCSRRDLIVRYFIEHEYYDLDEVNITLYDHGEEPLNKEVRCE